VGEFLRIVRGSKTIPLEYERSVRFIDAVVSGKLRGFEDYDLPKLLLKSLNRKTSPASQAGRYQ
jgi:hypothetical protein